MKASDVTTEAMGRPPVYREWLSSPRLSRFVVCTWAGQFGDGGQPYADRILPDGCIDVVWDGTQLTVAGPDTRSLLMFPRAGAQFVGLRFRPGLASSLLGVPASELLDARVDARDLLGEGATELAERLAGAPSLGAAAHEFELSAEAWLALAREPDRLVEGTVLAVGRAPPGATVAALARELGVGERRLLRHFVPAVGYGPKMFQRVLRLQRFIALGARPRNGAHRPLRRLADLAAEAGYADQAHMTRECRELTGATPTHFIGYLVTSGATM
jgi:AraC-like DNA-binding protein